MAAGNRFGQDYWQRRDGESTGTRSEIVTGPVSDWATDFSHLDPAWAAEHLYELERVAGDSHLSFSLLHGAVSLLAIYRSQDFISWAYGNYLGLGRVLQFVAHESGFPAGELTCVSASAAAEINRGGSFGHEQVEALPDDCEAALRMSP